MQATASGGPVPRADGPTPAPSAPSAPNDAAVQRAAAVDEELIRLYPDAGCTLDHDGPFQLLVATVLSAQTTDARVNTITPGLFARYPDAAALAGADRADLETRLRPLGMHHTRAARLIALGAELVAAHGGAVPADRKALVALPGVGRKTANVVLGNAFGMPAITVDTHVGRLSRRLGWTTAHDPLAVERDLAALWAPERWTDGCHRLIMHGRTVCRARAPRCEACVLNAAGLCPRVGV
ncbi:endonuclease III [Actinomyces ruminis]|uniref:Endonuclease III n=2 Tax=Actinomyces ruminis TaxID=1937003 RepID=A0ABX4MCZ7_9ACTO|nr:endonuclease III [Actinomyces ruminis]